MYVVSYDISNDKRRKKIAKEMENYGKRVQYSVFECYLDRSKYEELYHKLTILMAEETHGSIRIYRLCKTCTAQIVTIGVPDETKEKSDIDEPIII